VLKKRKIDKLRHIPFKWNQWFCGRGKLSLGYVILFLRYTVP